jgi:hypothetical protein
MPFRVLTSFYWEGTVSDIEGKFEFPIELKAGDVLVFHFIGFESEEYKVPKDAETFIEVRLTLYYSIMGEVVHDSVYTTETSTVRRWWQKVRELF